MNRTNQSRSYTVLTKNPVHEVKKLSWKLENALTTIDSDYVVGLPLPRSCPIKINLLVEFKRLQGNPESTEVSVGLQRTDKKRAISCIQLNYDLKLANLDGDVYAKKEAVTKLGCASEQHCVLKAKFTSNSMGGTNNDPDCLRLDTTVLMELATKNLFVMNEKQEIFFLLPGNVLFVVGDFSVIGCCTQTTPLLSEDSAADSNKEGWKVFVRDLKVAVDQGLHSDIKLVITEDQGGEARVFKLHKFILSARSGFFKSYLEEHDDEVEVSLEVTKIECFEALVNYLYSGEMDPAEQDVWSYLRLYTMAVGLQVEPLRKECMRSIAKLVNGEEVWGILEVAIDTKDQTLQDWACNHIADNQAVLESDRFNLFLQKKQEHAAKLLKSIIAKRRRQE